jgi:cell division protein FtsL
MLKLLLCLLCGSATAVALLELREQRLNLAFETNKLHNQIEASQGQLWNQQLEIAVATAPDALAASAKGKDLKLMSGNAAIDRSWVDDPGSQK